MTPEGVRRALERAALRGDLRTVAIRPEHMIEMGGGFCLDPETIAGFSAFRGDRLLAVCYFFMAADGRFWAGFARKADAGPSVHWACVDAIHQLASARGPNGEGVAELWAVPDPAVPRSEAFMRRLGFEPVGDSGEWRLGLGSGGGSPGGRRGRRSEISAGDPQGRP